MSEKVLPSQVGISTRNQPKYAPGEKILCFHGALIYEAKCLQVEKTRSNEYSYLVHYNGWSKNWDEWVPSKRILKYTEENLNKQKALIASQKKNSTKPTTSSSSSSSLPSSSAAVSGSTSNSNTSQSQQLTANKETSIKNEPNTNTLAPIASTNQSTAQSSSKEANGRLIRSTRKISSESSSAASKTEPIETPEPPKKQLCLIDLSTMYELELDSEASKIKIPDGLQDWLHNDSDFILEQNKILRIPANKPISIIVKDYQAFKINEKSKNEDDIKQLPYLNETMNSLIKYFNTMLGSQLLYKFERIQYKKVIESKKQVTDVYGAVHFLRLMEKLNQVLSCDIEYEKESFKTLVYFANDILKFIDKNSSKLFNEKDYINPPPFYVRASI